MINPAFDLEPAAAAMEAVVAGITDDQLDAPTPNDERTVRDLIGHVIGLIEGFRRAATKESVGNSQQPSQRPDLDPGWRGLIPAQLKALVAAWREPDAWSGETEAGSVTLPAPQAAAFALDELVIHGWDLARATSQSYLPDPESMTPLLDLLRNTPPEGIPGLFGPKVPVPDNAPVFDRVLGLTGRDPSWTAHK
ncbi:TIGR03086 family metal-binding protein [Nocardia sp. NPDC051030]|uniref:TIGR03086 family metal-binding protein n=1 Tax=Nocardia sp. NPDC051030 TaxID=3155162 RepID=UPI003447CDFB